MVEVTKLKMRCCVTLFPRLYQGVLYFLCRTCGTRVKLGLGNKERMLVNIPS
jgi:hypothetical protein